MKGSLGTRALTCGHTTRSDRPLREELRTLSSFGQSVARTGTNEAIPVPKYAHLDGSPGGIRILTRGFVESGRRESNSRSQLGKLGCRS